MTTRQMQDEQFRIQELLLYMAKGQVQAPEQEERPKSRSSSSSSSVSSISSNSSSSTSRQNSVFEASAHKTSTSSATTVEESSDDEFCEEVRVAIPVEESRPITVQIDPKSSRHESQMYVYKPEGVVVRQGVSTFSWSERTFRDRRSVKTVDVNTAVVIKLQAAMRRWKARREKQKQYENGVVCIFYVRH